MLSLSSSESVPIAKEEQRSNCSPKSQKSIELFILNCLQFRQKSDCQQDKCVTLIQIMLKMIVLV